MKKYLQRYYEEIVSRGKKEMAESIRTTAESFEGKLKCFTFTSHETGLLFGNVQSGKTAQMFGIISEAADYGIAAFILLTTDNVVLHKQTLDRINQDLRGFCICGEEDSPKFRENRLTKPTVIVLKKNPHILKLWANVFASTSFLKGNPLFIIDDEADAASLNTKVNQDKQSAINKYLDQIKNGAACSIYLQVTGTPQALFLQTIESGWHPLFTYYFEPGNGYLGGDFFFPADRKPDCVAFIDDMDNAMRSVVVRHLCVSAQIFLTGGTVCNCMIHPSVRTTEHSRFAEDVRKELNWCRDNETDFHKLVNQEYAEMHPEKSALQPLDQIWNKIQEFLTDGVKVLIMNGQNPVDEKEYQTGCSIVVGGNTLGRGVTFPHLQTVYYTRTSKKPQADTMWQHSRMFGYDRDPGLMKIFINRKLYKIFSELNAANDSMTSQLRQGVEHIHFYYPEGIAPTRKNVIDSDKQIMLNGGVNYTPFNPGNDSIRALDDLLKPFDERVSYYQVSVHLIIELLTHIRSDDDFSAKDFISALNALSASDPIMQGILIVRRNRDLAKGTGAVLSSDDWNLSKSFTSKVVLTMYKVNGIKGWGGRKLWIPNIKLPDDMVYYAVTGT